ERLARRRPRDRVQQRLFAGLVTREEGRMLAEHPRAQARAGVTRKEFIRTGAAGIGAAVLSGALLSPGAARAAGGTLKPTDLTFAATAQYRPLESIAKWCAPGHAV